MLRDGEWPVCVCVCVYIYIYIGMQEQNMQYRYAETKYANNAHMRVFMIVSDVNAEGRGMACMCVYICVYAYTKHETNAHMRVHDCERC